MINALNLYSGIGGNRLLWPKNVKVTAVESNEKIAAIYQKVFPKDIVIVGDAHDYLLKHYQEFDFIWSSPPCITHSRLNYPMKIKRYPDMALYQEIIFLASFFKGGWLVENVVSYYAPLIPPTLINNRHQFWANKAIHPFQKFHFPGFGHNNKGIEEPIHKLKWLGFDKLSFPESFKGITRPRQIVDNCVHPALGLHLFKQLNR